MCSASDHERIGPMLASAERGFTLAAHGHDEGAEKARDRRVTATNTGQIGGPEGHRRELERAHDLEIERHEGMARVNRRRAEHAAAGYLLHSPDESKDADYMQSHGDLFTVAQRTGRVKYSDESVA